MQVLKCLPGSFWMSSTKHDVIETLREKKPASYLSRCAFSRINQHHSHFGGSFSRATRARRGFYFHTGPEIPLLPVVSGSQSGRHETNPRRICFRWFRMKKILDEKTSGKTFGKPQRWSIKNGAAGCDADSQYIDLLRYKQFFAY